MYGVVGSCNVEGGGEKKEEKSRWRREREREWSGARGSEGEEASLFIALVNGARSSQSVRCYTWPAVVGVFGRVLLSVFVSLSLSRVLVLTFF